MRWLVLFSFCLNLAACTSLYYHPDTKFYFSPKELGYAPEEHNFRSLDGAELHAWYFPPRTSQNKGLLVQFHGNSQNISSHYTSLVWLTEFGYSLFIFDYRGFGNSRGEPNPKSVYEDGVAALRYAWQLKEKKQIKKFFLYAQSMGGIIGLRALHDFEQREKINLVVVDSSFSSFKDMAQERLAGNFLTWLFSPLGRVLVSDEYASKPYLAEIRSPMLIIHDKRDPIVKYRNAEILNEYLRTDRQVWELDQGGHVRIFNYPEARQRFRKYLEQNFP